MKYIQNIVFIGAGNVATHLALAFKKAGVQILQVCSRTANPARELAEKVQAEHTTNLQSLNKDADLYLISVSDNAVEELTSQLSLKDKLTVHTSGSIPLEILNKVSVNHGVFYPLQTFSKSREVDFSNIPICVEANSAENLEKLKSVAKTLSNNIYEVDSEQRKVLHLAAVFACNFPNFMYTIADKILRDSDIDFDILRPLIKETAEKIQDVKPAEAQTGPAIRNDEKILSGHMEMLNDFPQLKELYKLISAEIQKINPK